MKIDVIFNDNRKIEMSSTTIGVVGEKNATTLILNYNEYVPEGEKTLIFNNRKGSFTYNVENDEFRIPAAATTEERVQMQLEIKTEDQIWLSENIDLKLYKKADASGKNLLEDLIEEEVAASTQNITNKLYNFYDKYAKEVRENE